MAGYRNTRRILTLRQIVARRRKSVKYTDFRAQRPVSSPAAVAGKKI